ncbi:MAG: hypothetical protein GWO07_09265 [Candidatus Dadabacteria bacterium]|nr:hypothetical protein [Candidatus Dadabacteria bacterium]NIS08936.1 hypothetical protein [Candidatus Dadabacteria bacterium]NIV40838.1 hypothetical protein [Candidatus Dadabacteria bacterium]NIX15486.1 hypothetical protein [Candidatus Dadabacteria bacterium]NIY22807.1 hypothetical protein [Candidatus Dadabacteria bacterium]
MYQRTLILALSLFLFSTLNSLSRIEIELTGPTVQKIPIAIPDLNAIGQVNKNGRKFTEVLKQDLKNSGLFDIVQAPTSAGGTVNYQAYFDAGADALVKGDYKVSGSNIEIAIRLFDLKDEQPLIGRSYEASPGRLPEAAHRFANHILKELTGIDGFFTSKVVYVSGSKRKRDLYLMDYNGDNIRRLTNHKSLVLSPSCSKDGSKVVFNSDKVWDQDLYVIDLYPRFKEKRISNPYKLDQSAEWSPDGSKIVFSLDGDIAVASPSGKGVRKLTRGRAIDVSPTWSPDGTQIAFVSDRAGSPNIYVMSASGKNVRRITKGGYNTDPSWSPNPKLNKIAYVKVEKGGGVNIFTAKADGSSEQRLTLASERNENPSWTPDGHYISFVSNREGSNNIYLMFHNGHNPVRLSKGAPKMFPTWCG